MTCCTSFESVFNFVFPDAKSKDDMKFSLAKNDIFEFIKIKDEEYKGVDKQYREAIASLKRVIEYADYGLADKYRYCEKHFEKIVKEYKKNIFTKLELKEEDINNIPKEFADLRNTLMHCAIGEINSIHIAAYSMARCYIYVMILKKANVGDFEIQQSIDAIL